MRQRHALAALVALLAAGCGTTVDTATLRAGQPGAAGGEGLSVPSPGAVASVPGRPGVPLGSAAGGTGSVVAPGVVSGTPGVVAGSRGVPGGGTGATTAPIQLGILYSVNDGAQSAGVDNGNTFTVSRAVRALVASWNKTGGIGGRRIDPVYAEVHSASNDYDSQFQAACSAFTEDHHVAAVLTSDGFYSETLLTCLTKAGVPVVSGDYAAPDRKGAGQYPYYISPLMPLGNTRVVDQVNRLKASGFLTASNKIGVVIEGCPIDRRVFADALVPALRNAGLTLTTSSEARCFMSLQDFGGMASDTQNAVLAFRSQGVDRVMFVSEAAEGNLVLLFAEAADAQHYTPGYALDSVALPAILADNLPQSQLVNMRGLGWIPSVDSQVRSDLRPNASGKRCLARLADQGVQATSNADFYTAYSVCDGFAFLDTSLRTTRGDAGAGAVLASLDAIGSSFVAATTVDGRVTVSRARRTGAGAVRMFAYGGSCGCFHYTSGSFPF